MANFSRSDTSASDQKALQSLEAKIHDILPPQYRDCCDEVSPVAMGSASLAFGADGRVLWDSIWTHFCPLALAGGPPHRGTFLEPCSNREVIHDEEMYQEVVNEIGRGIWLVTGLPVLPRALSGWIGVQCQNETMAGWLVRAIVAENVLARHNANTLFLPAGPKFRLEKEIKNVIVSLAKTCHYWTGHMTADQQDRIGAIFGSGRVDAPLLEPSSAEEIQAAPERYEAMTHAIEQGVGLIGLEAIRSHCLGWIGIRCEDVRMAAWVMRAAVVENVLVRREGAVLYLPASLKSCDSERCPRIITTLHHVLHLWDLQKKLRGPLAGPNGPG